MDFIKESNFYEFWTSDNPVVKYNPYGNLGLIIDGIQLFFPLSPKFSLCILDPFCYSNFKEYKEFDILMVLIILKSGSFKNY